LEPIDLGGLSPTRRLAQPTHEGPPTRHLRRASASSSADRSLPNLLLPRAQRRLKSAEAVLSFALRSPCVTAPGRSHLRHRLACPAFAQSAEAVYSFVARPMSLAGSRSRPLVYGCVRCVPGRRPKPLTRFAGSCQIPSESSRSQSWMPPAEADDVEP